MKISVIIPALNEESSIAKVIHDLPKNYSLDILVVDNGSTDQTAQKALEAGARVITEPRKGYGRACYTGILHTDPDSEILVFLDGDYSDYPEELPLLVEPLLQNKADFVLGSRILGNAEKGSLTLSQKWGNWLATTLIRILFGFSYTDMGPFRSIWKKDLFKLDLKDMDYGWNVEMQVKALFAGLRIQEVPVSYRKRMGISKISGTWKGVILAGWKIIGRIVYHYIYSLRKKRK
ncbi:MAG: glycosyltransferase family 2 protein [Planctomycetota bacterium]|nr:MAG: glycosyltransferase family 2 protein [Planctomycetota bacterium]